MGEWRVLPLEQEEDSYMKMATEEAIMASVRKKTVAPTLRFYAWKRPAVALGYFQEADKELDLEKCKADNVEVFRRLTGGGAVYKSPAHELNYSFIIREDEEEIPKEVMRSYELICEAVIKGLKKLGFAAKFKPINDITIKGKKISGNAQTRVDNVLLHHGTILFKPEVEKMFTYLKIDDKKLLEKKVTSVKELVSGLDEYGKTTKEEVMEAITQGFEEVFKKQFKSSRLTASEREAANELQAKYAEETFIYWR